MPKEVVGPLINVTLILQGSLIPTKSHLFRLTLPLPAPDTKSPPSNSDQRHSPNPTNEVSFLLHPSQPLSHLSSLIIAELPHWPSSGHLVTFHGFQDPDPTVAGDEEDGVRWSQGTELGEFLRDAAKVREFSIRINLGEEWEIRVSVPNFEGTNFLPLQTSCFLVWL
jgi:calcium uniporter protein, mitochondrial